MHFEVRVVSSPPPEGQAGPSSWGADGQQERGEGSPVLVVPVDDKRPIQAIWAHYSRKRKRGDDATDEDAQTGVNADGFKRQEKRARRPRVLVADSQPAEGADTKAAERTTRATLTEDGSLLTPPNTHSSPQGTKRRRTKKTSPPAGKGASRVGLSVKPHWTAREDQIVLQGMRLGWGAPQIRQELGPGTCRSASAIRGRKLVLQKFQSNPDSSNGPVPSSPSVVRPTAVERGTSPIVLPEREATEAVSPGALSTPEAEIPRPASPVVLVPSSRSGKLKMPLRVSSPTPRLGVETESSGQASPVAEDDWRDNVFTPTPDPAAQLPQEAQKQESPAQAQKKHCSPRPQKEDAAGKPQDGYPDSSMQRPPTSGQRTPAATQSQQASSGTEARPASRTTSKQGHVGGSRQGKSFSMKQSQSQSTMQPPCPLRSQDTAPVESQSRNIPQSQDAAAGAQRGRRTRQHEQEPSSQQPPLAPTSSRDAPTTAQRSRASRSAQEPARNDQRPLEPSPSRRTSDSARPRQERTEDDPRANAEGPKRLPAMFHNMPIAEIVKLMRVRAKTEGISCQRAAEDMVGDSAMWDAVTDQDEDRIQAVKVYRRIKKHQRAVADGRPTTAQRVNRLAGLSVMAVSDGDESVDGEYGPNDDFGAESIDNGDPISDFEMAIDEDERDDEEEEDSEDDNFELVSVGGSILRDRVIEEIEDDQVQEHEGVSKEKTPPRNQTRRSTRAKATNTAESDHSRDQNASSRPARRSPRQHMASAQRSAQGNEEADKPAAAADQTKGPGARRRDTVILDGKWADLLKNAHVPPPPKRRGQGAPGRMRMHGFLFGDSDGEEDAKEVDDDQDED